MFPYQCCRGICNGYWSTHLPHHDSVMETQEQKSPTSSGVYHCGTSCCEAAGEMLGLQHPILHACLLKVGVLSDIPGNHSKVEHSGMPHIAQALVWNASMSRCLPIMLRKGCSLGLKRTSIILSEPTRGCEAGQIGSPTSF